MPLTFVLLALSICAVWLPAIRVGAKIHAPPWLVLLFGAIASGLAQGYLTFLAVLWIALLGVAARLATQPVSMRWQRAGVGTACVLALLMALHLLPGFHNPLLIANARFSVDAAPYTQYANFDKAVGGLLLLAFLCRRTRTPAEFRQLLRHAAIPILMTTTIVIGTAVALRYVAPDFKLPVYTPVFLITNLLFSCVAEEAFFRGVIQERLATALDVGRIGGGVVILISGLLFGLAHYAGGMTYVAISSVLGCGCAYCYAITRRVEAPILAHFALNAMHFIGFTYPRLSIL